MTIHSTRQQTLPLFAVFEETSVKNDGMTETNLLSLSYGRIVPKSIDTVGGLLPASFEGYQIVNPGQIVLRLTDMQNDQKSLRSALVQERGIITSAYCALQNRGWDAGWNQYFDYFFHALDVSKKLYSLGGGVRQSLKYADIKHVQLVIPSESTRDKIVRFLDEETAKIDNLIAKQVSLKKLLSERLFSATDRAIEMATCNAKRERLKRLLTKLRRPVPDGAEIVTAYDDGEVTLRSKRRLDGYWVSTDESTYQGVQSGDFVFHGLDGYRGAVGISDSVGKMTPACHVCNVSKEIRSDFLAIYLRFLGESGFLKNQSMTVRGDSMDFRNWQKVAALEVPVPSQNVQRELVGKIVDLKSDMRAIESTINRMIKLLQERRSALITAAVTGQIEV